jgi:hypothetical protein
MGRDNGKRKVVRTPPDCEYGSRMDIHESIMIGANCQWRLVPPELGVYGTHSISHLCRSSHRVAGFLNSYTPPEFEALNV